MGILTRFKDIMSANINALLDKCEDPSKMIDQYLRDLTENLAEVKKETAAIMAEEKRAKRLVDENAAEVAKYVELAKKALVSGNDEDAKVFINKKQNLEAAAADLKKTYDAAHENAVKMREMHDKLVSDINSLEARRQTVKAKVAVAKTQEKMNKISGSLNASSGTMRAFENMEAKVDRMLDSAQAAAELNKGLEDSAENLAKKYAGAVSSSVNDELASLKAELGL